MTSFHSVKGKDAVRGFVNAGGTIRQGKGDHVNIKMPNGQLITIPVSGDVKLPESRDQKGGINRAGI